MLISSDNPMSNQIIFYTFFVRSLSCAIIKRMSLLTDGLS